MRKIVSVGFLALLCFLLLSGCGAEAPDSIALLFNGEETAVIDILNGEELTGLRAVISPSGYEGEIKWSSSDSGIVKITEAAGTECTLAAKKTGSAKITAECGEISTSVRVHVMKDPNNLTARDTALTIHGVAYSSEQVAVAFAEQFYTFAEENGDYADYYGLDLTAGIQSLADQSCSYSSDGTWRGFFLEAAENYLMQVQALCDYAFKNGISLSEEELTEIGQRIDALADMAEQAGLGSAEEYLSEYYGSGITAEMLRDYLERSKLADVAYEYYTEALSYSEDELAAHYAEMGYEGAENDYPVAAMRHILIMAEADENGDYTEEAIAAAHEKAEEVFGMWSSGEKTEDRFSELAGAYSEDAGSIETGGLYEDIYKGQMVVGIDEWLFDKKRTAGDTAVIDNNGSYVGTHIVYFVGYGDLYSNVLALEDLKSADISAWLENLTADYTPEQGADHASIGKY